MLETRFNNPYRPGAGHQPPYLAGREDEKEQFCILLNQSIILENLVLTGLRGVGKTVLLETFKPIALTKQWMWVGTDLSESASLSEDSISIRLLADLALLTSQIVIGQEHAQAPGFTSLEVIQDRTLNFETLTHIYKETPGLVIDKLKHVLESVWAITKHLDNFNGIVFAYDEAQNLTDHADKEQFPLSTLLDLFQSIQRMGIPFMLALTGLPTLFPKLVESRTYSERMFRVMFLDKLEENDIKEAILEPLKGHNLQLTPSSIDTIVNLSGGYPYFVQFICREVYDLFIQQISRDVEPRVPIEEILQKLDTDFFAGRWSRATDRQRELLCVIAKLKDYDKEFAVQDILQLSKKLMNKPFSSSHVNQMLVKLAENGLIYKNRHGKYSFAVPLLGDYINRQEKF